MGSLEARRLDRAALSQEHYFQTLLEQARRRGLLTGEDERRIQLGCLAILREVAGEYALGDSSIRIEAAQNLFASISYTIGLALKACPSPEEAAEALRTEEPAVLYQRGRRQAARLLRVAKSLHSRIAGHLLDTPNVFYRATLVEGIQGFFKLYRPDFSAHEIHITADYPPYLPVNSWVGIEFINRYLENLSWENAFCRLFPPEKVHALLLGLDPGYPKLLFNLFEPVYLTALGCSLVQADAKNLTLSEVALEYLSQLFRSRGENGLIPLLRTALGELSSALTLSGPMLDYLGKCLPQAAAVIRSALEAGTLRPIFPLPQAAGAAPSLHFFMGNRMEDWRYRRVVEELLLCRTGEARLAVIEENIRSLADLEDILLDGCLASADIRTLLRGLSPIETAALLKLHPSRGEDCGECEAALIRSLQEHLNSLPREQRAWLLNTSRDLTLDEERV